MYSDAAKQAALDAMWGDNRGITMPANLELGLIIGDPRETVPVELAYPGYARIPFVNDNTFWDDADANGVKLSKKQQFPDSTGAATTVGAADFWAIFLPGGLVTEIYDFGRLAQKVAVSGAGTGPALKVRRTFTPGLI